MLSLWSMMCFSVSRETFSWSMKPLTFSSSTTATEWEQQEYHTLLLCGITLVSEGELLSIVGNDLDLGDGSGSKEPTLFVEKSWGSSPALRMTSWPSEIIFIYRSIRALWGLDIRIRSCTRWRRCRTSQKEEYEAQSNWPTENHTGDRFVRCSWWHSPTHRPENPPQW